MLSPALAEITYDSEELKLFRKAARGFMETECVPHNARWEQNGVVDRELWYKAGAAGLLCASIPTEYGGGGGHFGFEKVVLEEQARAGISGWGNPIHSPIVAHYVLAYASEAQKKRWLPKLASGELVGAIAMTEPGTGSDLQSVATTAIADGDHYVINGSKTFVSNGQHCGLLIVVAKTDPSEKARGVSLIVVETDGLAGFRRGRNLEKVGLHAQDTSELFFDDVRVPRANLLGSMEGGGFFQLMQQLPQERMVIAISALVAWELSLEVTTQYVKDRKAFGKRVLDFQHTRFSLAEAYTEATLARVFVERCTQLLIDKRLDPATAAMAKWWISEKQFETTDKCMQLHGGYGYMTEYPISKIWRDSRVQRIFGGTNEIMKELIGRCL